MGAVSLDDPQTLNLYAYCVNDPINHTDPDGLFFKKLFGAIAKAFKWVLRVAAVLAAVAVVLAVAWGLPTILGIALWKVALFAGAALAASFGAGKLAQILGAAAGFGVGEYGSFRTPPTFPPGTGVGGVSSFVHGGRGGRGGGGGRGGRGGRGDGRGRWPGPPRSRGEAWARIIYESINPPGRYRPPVRYATARDIIGPLQFRGLVQNRPLRDLTHQEIMDAFEGTPYRASDHLVLRLKDIRTENLGVRTLNDFASYVNNGVIGPAHSDRISITYRGLQTIVDPPSRTIVTFRPE
jgi:hypothetical protein